MTPFTRSMKPSILLITFSALTPLCAEVTFKKQTLTTEFVAEGCDMADFNHDGHMDITAGCFLWYGPDFSKRENFTPPSVNADGPSKTPYNPAKGYSDYFLAYAHDFNGDTWADILVYGLPGEPALLYLNPQGKPGDWAEVIFREGQMHCAQHTRPTFKTLRSL